MSNTTNFYYRVIHIYIKGILSGNARGAEMSRLLKGEKSDHTG